MKLVALDVGEKRIGVAAADSSVKIAVPQGVVMVDGSELEQLAKIIRSEGAEHLIVGLPRNSHGEETAQSERVRSFIISLQSYFVKHKLGALRVRFQDESLTSVIAEQRLSSNKRRQRQKGDIDAEAAAIILQDFLDSFDSKKVEDEKEQGVSKKKPKKRHKFLKFLTVFVALVIVLAVVAIGWYTDAIRAIAPAEDCKNENPQICKQIEFEVAEGESKNAIADRLESEKLIKSSFAMQIYLLVSRENLVLKAGTYTLNNAMSVEDIAKRLNGGGAAETFSITFLPGGTLSDAKQRLSDAGFADTEIEAALTATYNHPVLEGKPAEASLEGYIYGETYEFYADATVAEVLTRTFDELYAVVKDNSLVEKFKAQGLSLYEGLTLASIVQREAYAADQPTVAQVFLLRLKKAMPLGSDVVIGYEADRLNPNRDKSDMSYLTTIGCPWNSRRCTDLPPTPISNPGKSALLAVANPSTTDYLYFLTGDDGKMYYNHTLEEHEQDVADHCKSMCNIL